MTHSQTSQAKGFGFLSKIFKPSNIAFFIAGLGVFSIILNVMGTEKYGTQINGIIFGEFLLVICLILDRLDIRKINIQKRGD